MNKRIVAGCSVILGLIATQAPRAAAGEVTIETALPTQPTGLIEDHGEIIGGAIEGVDGLGTIYRLVPPTKERPSWSVAPLLVASGAAGDGQYYSAPLVKDRAGNLYGTTHQGGSGACSSPYGGCGTLFELVPPTQPSTGTDQGWTEQTLFDFSGNVDHDAPLAIDAAGNLYLPAGENVLEFSPPAGGAGPWTMTTIYSDPGNVTVNGLKIDPKGALYGVAQPSSGSGPLPEFIYKLSPPATAGAPWTRRVIEQFDASLFLGQLALRGGKLYVATNPSASSGACTSKTMCSVLDLAPVAGVTAWSVTVLHSFAGDPLGRPSGSAPTYTLYATIPYLSFGPDGSIYGAIAPRDRSKKGDPNATIYKLAKPAAAGAPWAETTLYTFDQQPYGFSAGTPMLITGNGTVFGTAVAFDNGGTGDYDSVAFRITQP